MPVREHGAQVADRPAEAQRLHRTSDVATHAPHRPRLLLYGVTAGVTIAFSYFAFKGVKFGVAWHALRTCDAWWLAAACLAFVLGTLARALRWRSLFARDRRPRLGAVG